MYSPVIPRKKRITPVKKNKEVITARKPFTGTSNVIFLINRYIPIISPTEENKKPIKDVIRNGKIEKFVIIFHANATNFLREYPLLPWGRDWQMISTQDM